jgi:aryl-alcohol dehydrogenase-like predicted oxidoreductase
VEQVRLGRSDLMVSRLAFGTWQLGGDWGPTDTAAALDAIRQAADAGVTFFDTAQAYGFGQSEQLLSAALRGVARDQVVIATKGGLRPSAAGLIRDSSADWLREGVDASLRALGTDYVDLYQLHWPDPVTPLDETAETLVRLMTEGKIRHVGVANFNVDQLAAFEVVSPVETLQPPYNLFRRTIEADILPYTSAHDIGVLVCAPLAHGLLSANLGTDSRFTRDDWRSKSAIFRGANYAHNLRVVAELGALATELGLTLPQLAISWTLANPAVQVAIVGTRNHAHVDEALVAATIQLDDEVMRRIADLTVSAVPVVGPSPEEM